MHCMQATAHPEPCRQSLTAESARRFKVTQTKLRVLDNKSLQFAACLEVRTSTWAVKGVHCAIMTHGLILQAVFGIVAEEDIRETSPTVLDDWDQPSRLDPWLWISDDPARNPFKISPFEPNGQLGRYRMREEDAGTSYLNNLETSKVFKLTRLQVGGIGLTQPQPTACDPPLDVLMSTCCPQKREAEMEKLVAIGRSLCAYRQGIIHHPPEDTVNYGCRIDYHCSDRVERSERIHAAITRLAARPHPNLQRLYEVQRTALGEWAAEWVLVAEERVTGVNNGSEGWWRMAQDVTAEMLPGRHFTPEWIEAMSTALNEAERSDRRFWDSLGPTAAKLLEQSQLATLNPTAMRAESHSADSLHSTSPGAAFKLTCSYIQDVAKGLVDKPEVWERVEYERGVQGPFVVLLALLCTLHYPVSLGGNEPMHCLAGIEHSSHISIGTNRQWVCLQANPELNSFRIYELFRKDYKAYMMEAAESMVRAYELNKDNIVKARDKIQDANERGEDAFSQGRGEEAQTSAAANTAASARQMRAAAAEFAHAATEGHRAGGSAGPSSRELTDDRGGTSDREGNKRRRSASARGRGNSNGVGGKRAETRTASKVTQVDLTARARDNRCGGEGPGRGGAQPDLVKSPSHSRRKHRPQVIDLTESPGVMAETTAATSAQQAAAQGAAAEKAAVAGAEEAAAQRAAAAEDAAAEGAAEAPADVAADRAGRTLSQERRGAWQDAAEAYLRGAN